MAILFPYIFASARQHTKMNKFNRVTYAAREKGANYLLYECCFSEFRSKSFSTVTATVTVFVLQNLLLGWFEEFEYPVPYEIECDRISEQNTSF